MLIFVVFCLMLTEISSTRVGHHYGVLQRFVPAVQGWMEEVYQFRDETPGERFTRTASTLHGYWCSDRRTTEKCKPTS